MDGANGGRKCRAILDGASELRTQLLAAPLGLGLPWPASSVSFLPAEGWENCGLCWPRQTAFAAFLPTQWPFGNQFFLPPFWPIRRAGTAAGLSFWVSAVLAWALSCCASSACCSVCRSDYSLAKPLENNHWMGGRKCGQVMNIGQAKIKGNGGTSLWGTICFWENAGIV